MSKRNKAFYHSAKALLPQPLLFMIWDKAAKDFPEAFEGQEQHNLYALRVMEQLADAARLKVLDDVDPDILRLINELMSEKI